MYKWVEQQIDVYPFLSRFLSLSLPLAQINKNFFKKDHFLPKYNAMTHLIKINNNSRIFII